MNALIAELEALLQKHDRALPSEAERRRLWQMLGDLKDRQAGREFMKFVDDHVDRIHPTLLGELGRIGRD